MNDSPPGEQAERVLIHAPTGRDAALACRLLATEGLSCHDCTNQNELEAELGRGAGLVLVGQEVLDPPAVARLVARLEEQPVWSDLPVVVLTREGCSGEELVSSLGPRVNVTVLERPVRVSTLVSTVLTSLRARRRQYEVRDLVHRLAESDRRKDEFLAMLGHELRNPLSAISTATAILRETGVEVGSQERQAALIERQVRHLSRMVDDLLDLSRLSRGKIALQSEPVELRQVARGAVETLEMAGHNGNHHVAVRLPDDPVVVTGDPLRLEQVVANLLQNAVKYTPEGGHVEVTLARGGGDAMIRVRDDGVGIATEDLAGIFDPFTQLGNPTRSSPGGLGVGLFLTRRLVELHGGRIEADSEGPGKGTEFTVRLPMALTAGAPSPERPPQEERPAERDGTPGDAVSVLLVEDNLEAREALEELLKIWGCRVTAVGSGAEAVERYLEEPPDLAIVDIGLPDLDGYEVARRLRRELGERCGHLVALTGFGQPDDRERALEAGFDQHVVKPVDPGKLTTMLDRVRGASPRSTPNPR